jgi:multidrug resistance efflux pump
LASNHLFRESNMPATHGTILRVSSLTVVGAMSALMVTAVMPPIVADQSDRAIVNAPVTLVTSPIEGDIQSIEQRLGQSVEAQDVIARISNPRVDRSALIQLEERASGVKQQLESARRKKSSDRAYLQVLDGEIARQKQQLERDFQAQISELEARVAESVAMGGEKQAWMDQQNDMIARNVASPKLVRPTMAQHEAMLRRADADRAKLQQKRMQLAALRDGIFVGDHLMAPLGDLAQKRRDVELDAKRQEIEETELEGVSAELARLASTENDRIQKLSAADVTAAGTGHLLLVEAAGKHVKAGDTLASLVDCDRRFIVAIFSYRQGQNLAVGSRVRIDGAPVHSGVVRAVLPKTSDKSDQQFAVPFPQTERRELYAVIAPDAEKTNASVAADSGKQGCGVGEWVTVTRDSGVVPSVSVSWRNIEHKIMTWWGGGPGDAVAETQADKGGRKALAAAMGQTSSGQAARPSPEAGSTTNWLRAPHVAAQ